MSRQDWMGSFAFLALGAVVCRVWLAAPPAFTWIAVAAVVAFLLLAAVEYDWFGGAA